MAVARRITSTWVEADVSDSSPARRFTAVWVEADISLMPHIVGLTPSAGGAGTSVTVSGVHFGANEGTVAFNGISATITAWADTEITVTVPEGDVDGLVVVTAASGYVSNGVAFSATLPVLGEAALDSSAALTSDGAVLWRVPLLSLTSNGATLNYSWAYAPGGTIPVIDSTGDLVVDSTGAQVLGG